MPEELATDVDLSTLEADLAADDTISDEPQATTEPAATPEPATPATPESAPAAIAPTPATTVAPVAPESPDLTKLLFDHARATSGIDLEAAGYKSPDEVLADLIRANQEAQQGQEYRRRYEQFAPYQQEFQEFLRNRNTPAPAPAQPEQPKGFQVPKKPDLAKFYEYYEQRKFVDNYGREQVRWAPTPECPAAYREQYEKWAEWDASHRRNLFERPDEYIGEMGFARAQDIDTLRQEMLSMLNHERKVRATWEKVDGLVKNLPAEYLIPGPDGNRLSPRGLIYDQWVTYWDKHYAALGVTPDPEDVYQQAMNAERAAYFMAQPMQPPAIPAAMPPPVPQPPAATAAAGAAPIPVSPAVAKTPSRRSATQRDGIEINQHTSLQEVLDADGTTL